MSPRLSRRRVLQLLAGAALAENLSGCADSSPSSSAADSAGDEGWGAGWVCNDVANLKRENGVLVLEAGSDIFPNDPRPVAFAIDSGTLNGSIRAEISDAGSAVGVVLRRTSPRHYYAAIHDLDRSALILVRRSDFDLVELASALVSPLAAPGQGRTSVLEFEAAGAGPTALHARLTGADGLTYEVMAGDSTEALQRAGDAGVLTQSDTLLPDSNPVLPSLGNLHLLPYSVQQGQAVIATPAGQQFIDLIRRRSTARFVEIAITSEETPQPTTPQAIAVTTGAPQIGGATLQVASDVPAQVTIEISSAEDFSGSSMIEAGATDAFNAIAHDLAGQSPGTLYWRAHLRRGALSSISPARRFRVLPPPGDPSEFSLVYGACASQFNGIFDQIAARNPDLFIWNGDLNYPDTHGPFAQTIPGYAGIWRAFLVNPRIAPILRGACFAGTRDDHDYGVQDANSTILVPWGLAPWDSLMNPRRYQLISAGVVDVWMLDQRLQKSDPDLPDNLDKTLIGMDQRAWLLDTLASSTAPFKIICSPCTIALGANSSDGNWSNRFSAERDLVLDAVRRTNAPAIFLTGDTHFTMLFDLDGFLEQRACPLDIPLPNDQSIANPTLELNFGQTPGVQYWSRLGHFSLVRAGADEAGPYLVLELVREDGVVVSSRRFGPSGAS